MTTTLEVQRMLANELDTMTMSDLYPELRFVFDLIDKLREEADDVDLYRARHNC